MSLLRRLATELRLGLFQLLGGAARRVEPRHDPAHLAKQLERGELVWRAFVDAGTGLRRSGRFDAADAMIERGLAVFPGDRTLLYEHAFCAHVGGRYALAVTRWEAALAVAPDLAMCHAGVAANLRELGELERAAETIATAMKRFPDDLTVLSEAARIADARLRFDVSLPLWRRAAATPDAAAEWMQGEAHALLRLGRFGEAAASVAAARARHPADAGLMAVEGLLASERRDWPRAVAIWSDYHRRFPEDGVGREQFERASRGALAASGPRAMSAPKDTEVRDLLRGFVSLGETAELERVQRRYGAGDPNTLCWHAVTCDDLLAALRESFVGFGVPADVEVLVATDDELLVRDRRWGLELRGSPRERAETSEQVLAEACRDLVVFRDRLLADLTAAEKIFVFRSTGLEADRSAALHRALSTFGPVRLLEVQPAAPTAPTLIQGVAGDLVTVGPGRLVGFLEPTAEADDSCGDAALEDWITLCRKASPTP